MTGPTCADLHCNTSPNCSIAPSCPLIPDRVVAIVEVLAARLDVILASLVGCVFAASAAVIVVGGHGETAVVTLATMVAGFGLTIFGYVRLKSGQTETTKKLKEIGETTDKAADRAAESVVRTDETANTIIRNQTSVAKKIEEVHHDVNNKAAAVAEAKAAGIASVIAVLAEEDPKRAASVAAKMSAASDSKF